MASSFSLTLGCGCWSSLLGVYITDCGMWRVSAIFLAIGIPLRVRRKEIKTLSFVRWRSRPAHQTEHINFKPIRSAEITIAFLVSVMGQKQIEPHPGWSPLGVWIQISWRSSPFHNGVPPERFVAFSWRHYRFLLVSIALRNFTSSTYL